MFDFKQKHHPPFGVYFSREPIGEQLFASLASTVNPQQPTNNQPTTNQQPTTNN